jgi:SAM-dependent methyltransferase
MMALLSAYLSKTRYARIVPHVRGDVLDIGCQHGQLRAHAAERINRYAGIDLSEEDIRQARRAHPDCEFKALNIDDEPLGYEAAFDTIVLCAVIEHIFNLKHLGQGLALALRPGGRVILTTPTPFGNDVVHNLGAKLGLFSQVAVDDHIVIFNRKRLQIFAGEAGLVLAAHKLFQLGCNQFAILEKPGGSTPL